MHIIQFYFLLVQIIKITSKQNYFKFSSILMIVLLIGFGWAFEEITFIIFLTQMISELNCEESDK